MKNIKSGNIGRMILSALFIFILLATPIVLGCGKKGPPKPPKMDQAPEQSNKG